jgi:alkylation response protein AidB-like acyl-CoA dehydrogenase
VDFEWTEEQELLRENVRRFMEENASIDFVRAQWDDPAGVTAALWSKLSDLGVTGLLIPEAYAGAGLGVLDMGVVLEELGRVIHPGPFLSSALVATRLLIAAGSEKDRAAWLPRLAGGAARVAVALENGDDAIRATRTGEVWQLCGDLGPVMDAAACDALLVPAQVDAVSRIFLLECEAPSVGLTPFGQVDGTRRLFHVALEQAPAQLVGEADASEALAEARDLLAIGLVADAVGAADRALELSTAYASEREQFGRPIGSFQSLQHLMVDMLQSIELVRAAVIHALWTADAAPPAERAHAASIAKAFAAEALPGVGASAIQVFGGLGFTWEMDIHLFDKRLCSQALLGGDGAHHLERLAMQVLD